MRVATHWEMFSGKSNSRIPAGTAHLRTQPCLATPNSQPPFRSTLPVHGVVPGMQWKMGTTVARLHHVPADKRHKNQSTWGNRNHNPAKVQSSLRGKNINNTIIINNTLYKLKYGSFNYTEKSGHRSRTYDHDGGSWILHQLWPCRSSDKYW